MMPHSDARTQSTVVFWTHAMPRDPGIKIEILARRECDLTESLQPTAGPEAESTDPSAFMGSDRA